LAVDFESLELKLADLPCLGTLWETSTLVLRAVTTLFADCPRPLGCGRGSTGEGREGTLLKVDVEAYWFNFDGDAGRWGGENVPGPAKRGEFIRDDDDTVELGLGGGKCGEEEVWRSGTPFAWKNFGWARSSATLDPTADVPELCGDGIESPLA
jgi:hypothetical protein